jgi:UDP-glucuronate 4-epimerase
MTILVTGGAGFIGSSLINQLIGIGQSVVAVDSLSDYYSVDLKKSRLEILSKSKNFKFFKGDVCDKDFLNKIFNTHKFTSIHHLAAQAGVRLPISESFKYIDSNIQGFLNIAEKSIEHDVDKFMYASSSSIYGDEAKIPFSESELNLNPSSIYGVSKLANEKLASVLSKSSTTKFRGLRFFTVYGPWGRPDMAYFKLIASALTGMEFKLYGNGSIKRDFTYIDDIVDSIVLLSNELDNRPKGFNDLVNIGGGKPISISQVIEQVEKETGAKIEVNKLPPNKLDLQETCADFTYLNSLISQKPSVSFESGLAKTIEWAVNNEIKVRIQKWAKSIK